MVAVIGCGREEGEYNGQKGLDLHTALAQPAVEAVARKVGRRIIGHPHLKSARCQFAQLTADFAADIVILELEELEMNVVGGLVHIFEHIVHHFVEGGVDAHIIARKRNGLVGHPEQGGNIVVPAGDIPAKHRTVCLGDFVLELTQMIVADQPFLPLLRAEKKIQYNTHNGQQDEDKNPGKRAYRVTVLRDDYYHQRNQRQRKKYVQQIIHFLGGSMPA